MNDSLVLSLMVSGGKNGHISFKTQAIESNGQNDCSLGLPSLAKSQTRNGEGLGQPLGVEETRAQVLQHTRATGNPLQPSSGQQDLSCYSLWLK